MVMTGPIDNSLISRFSKDIQDLINLICQKGFYLALVGGAVRDLLISNQLGNDLDFEIRHPKGFSGDIWEEKLLTLFEDLRDKHGFQVEHLPFLVFRIKLKDFDVEFSSPRQEIFQKSGEALNHKNFLPKFDSNLSYKKAFYRRDFTVNAMAAEIKAGKDKKPYQVELIDPFGGLADIAGRVLRFCGDDFTKDPVRFLRLIRFANRLDFSYHGSLLEKLSQFDLSKLTVYYFLSEAGKSDFFRFTKNFFTLVKEEKIKVSPQVFVFEPLARLPVSDFTFSTNDHLFLFSVLHGREDITDDEFRLIGNELQVKKALENQVLTMKDILSVVNIEKYKSFLKDISKEGISDLLENKKIELLELFHVAEKKLKQSGFNLGEYLPDDFQVIYQFLKDVVADDLKGEDKFREFLSKNEFDESKRSLLRIIAHLQDRQ
jgi:hypothetical protein